jgi:hypothetical protein
LLLGETIFQHKQEQPTGGFAECDLIFFLLLSFFFSKDNEYNDRDSSWILPWQLNINQTCIQQDLLRDFLEVRYILSVITSTMPAIQKRPQKLQLVASMM